MQKNTLFLSFVLGCMTIFASAQSKAQLELMKNSKVITPTEIISRIGFKFLKPYDQVHNSFTESSTILTTSPLAQLKATASYISNGDITAVWMIRSDKLYLKELVNLKLNEELFATINAKIQEYDKNDKGLILASWYSGELECVHSSLITAFGYATKYITTYRVEKGVIVDQTNLSCYHGSMEFCQPTSREVQLDGDWYTDPRYNFQCLAQYLNSNYRPSRDMSGFLWLLTTDKDGFSHLTTLISPSSFNHDQNAANKAVEKLVEKLPQYSFGFLMTADRQLYSGRFIEAKYTKSDGWKLMETVTSKL